MIKNQVFKRIQKYSDQYLLGFDHSNLDIQLLKGNIQVKNVKFNVQRINQELIDNNVPFLLKYGLLGSVNIKLNYFSIFTNPVNVNVSDIVLVLCPNNNPLHPLEKARRAEMKKKMEEEKSKKTPAEYKMERSVSAPFNENDFLEFYESQKETAKEEEKKDEKKKKKKMNYFIKKYILTNLHNLTFAVSKIHIRIEENLISQEPFSLGFIIDKISMNGSKEVWQFKSSNSMNFKRHKPESAPNVIKEIKIYNIRLYCDSMSKILPTHEAQLSQVGPAGPPSALEALQPVLEKVSPSALKALLHDSHKYLIEPFNVFMNVVYDEPKDKPIVCADILLTKLQFNVTPTQVVDLLNLLEFMNNFYIWPYLRKLKPKFRPRYRGGNKRDTIRKWFMMAVWYVRIKKMLKDPKALRNEGVRAFLETQLKHDPKFRRFPNLDKAAPGYTTDEQKRRSNSMVIGRMRAQSQQSHTSQPMSISELQTPQGTEPPSDLDDDMANLGINLNLRLERITLAVFDSRLLSYNKEIHPSLQVNLDVSAIVQAQVICISANVMGKDEVKAKLLMHDFAIKAAVETPPNEISVMMRESMRMNNSVNQSRYFTPMRGRKTNDANLIFSSVKGRFRSPDVTKSKFFARPTDSRHDFQSISPLKMRPLYIDDHTDTPFFEETFIQIKALGDVDSAVSFIVQATIGAKVNPQYPRKTYSSSSRPTHTPMTSSLAVGSANQYPRVSEARSQTNSLYDALHGPSRNVSPMREPASSGATMSQSEASKPISAEVNGNTRKLEIFYSGAMLENLCRVAKQYKGIIDYYKPDPIVGQSSKMDEAVIKIMKEWAQDERIKQNRSLDIGQWVQSGAGKMIRKVTGTPMIEVNSKLPSKLTPQQEMEELDGKLKNLNFRVNLEFGGIQIGLMNQNRLQSVATVIIPRGPITIAKSPYNMRVGAYGFGFTTTNSLSNLFAYMMNAKTTLEALQKQMEGKREMPLGVAMFLQKEGQDEDFESVSRFKPQWSQFQSQN